MYLGPFKRHYNAVLLAPHGKVRMVKVGSSSRKLETSMGTEGTTSSSLSWERRS